MSNSVLPEELILCILTRLPVKSIIRFKSVCKSWYDLFSTPEFKKLHQSQFSSDPKNQSFIIHRYCCSDPENQFSIFNIESNKKRPTIAYVQDLYVDTVGCCSGLVCIRGRQEIVLWNPAMKLSKTVSLKDFGDLKKVSLGFGYDSIGDDCKVVMIVTEGINLTSVEIYSVNLDSWITVNVGFGFSLFHSKNDLIVNGNPYWVALVDQNKVLLRFDVLELVFKIVPVPTNLLNYWTDSDVDIERMKFELVDWNGALGALIINYECCTVCFSRVECVSVWVFDDIEQVWINVHSFGPIDVHVDRVLHCIKNEKILGTFEFNKLFVFDIETACVEELFDGARLGLFFEVYGYTESLAHIKGMQKVVVKSGLSKGRTRGKVSEPRRLKIPRRRA